MAEGISPNPLNKITQVYLDRIAKINTDPEIAQKEREKWQTEAKVDTGSAAEKATTRNKRNTPPGKDYDFDNKVFITRKPGESLESARTRKRRDAHAAKRGVKENFSDWRTDLREIVDEIESEAEKKVDEKKNIKNKVVINPKLGEAVEQMGGQLLEVAEVEDDKEDKDLQKAEALKKKEAQLKKRIVRMKMQAVNQGAGENIIAGYEPDIEGAVEYFYEEGINEEGIDLLIEEIGLEEFVDFVDGGAVDLNEERKARKMNVRTKAKLKKDVEAIKADKSDVVKTGPKDTLARARTERAFKKRKLAKPAPKSKKDYDGDGKKETPKQEHRGVRNKKITKAVKKVKPAQPKKPVSKKGIRAKVKSAYEAGVKRHRKATQPIRVFHKGMKKAPKAVAKAAVDVKRAIAPRKESYDPMDDPDFDHDEAEKNRGVSGKNNPKGGKKLKDLLKNGKNVKEGKIADALKKTIADMKAADRKAGLLPGGKDVIDLDVERERRRKKVEEGKLTSVKATTYGMPPEERKAHIDAERKRLGVKPKPEKKIEEEVGISSTEKMAAARKEAKLKAKEAAAVKKAKSDKQKAAARKKSINANKQLSSTELKKYDTDGDGKIRVVNASYNWRKELAQWAVSNGRSEMVVEKDLNAAERRALPDKDFVFPGKGEGPEGKQRGAYPINDKKHARAALAMAAAHASPEKEAKVKAAVKKKYPGIQQEAIETQAKDRKKLGQPHSVSGSRRDHSHDVDSALTDYVPRKGKGRMRPASKKEMRVSAMREDKAFDNVVGKLRKKYGKDAVLTKDSPKPKAQLQPKAKPQKPLSADEKAEREIDAQYGGRANRLAGRGLGT